MLQVSVNRRQLVIFTAVIALFVSVAWIGAANQARAGSATPVVYVATGENFPDALGAGPAAAIVRGPILLVAQNSIPGETAAELIRLAPDKIIIVGGTAVVSPAVEDGLKAYAGTVERIAGSNRYDTAAKLSAATFPALAAPLPGTIDADTLDGKDSAAFASSGHDHGADYLAISGKAADADLLDGLDSTAFLGVTETAADSTRLDGTPASKFVKQGEIVMTQSGNGWMVRPAGSGTGGVEPILDERTAHSAAFHGDGVVVFGLTGPSVIDGSKYGLASFDVCLTGAGTPVLDVRAVAINFFDPPNPDDPDIYIDVTVQNGEVDRGSGCYTYVVNSRVGQGIGLQATITGGVELFSVKSRWSPAALGG